jgi:hypothetical protein
VAEHPAQIAGQIWTAMSHRLFAAITLSLAWITIAIFLWIWGDWRMSLEALTAQLPLFVRSKGLKPRHFDLAGFNSYYHIKPEFATGMQSLRKTGRVLISGRPAAGKSRMAYELAKQFPRHWVLRVPPDFKDWEKIQIPYIPLVHDIRIIWFLDDLDKFVGGISPSQSEESLKQKSKLLIIATCREGDELQKVYDDKTMGPRRPIRSGVLQGSLPNMDSRVRSRPAAGR